MLSTALLFLVGGVLIGAAALDLIHIDPQSGTIRTLADLALFTVLFTDGQRANLRALRERFGDLLSEVARFAALLVFGTLITADRLTAPGLGGWITAVLVILLIRPATILISLIRSDMPLRERATAAWFGPKGFASVVYGLLVLQAGVGGSGSVFALVVVTIAISIVLHSSTDVPVARAFDMEDVAPTFNLPDGESGRYPPARTEDDPG